VIKLIISFFLIFIFSCEPVSKDIVINKIEQTKENIVDEIKYKKKNIKEDKKISNDKIFYLVGDPYFIEGVEYIPEEDYSYNKIGLATFYDKELHKQKTANNDLNKVTELLGRHKTLPLPSIVKITNLENGLSLTIKIVDRHDDNISIIQVSRKVAQLLRFYKNKITKARVEILIDPSKQWKNVTMSINDKDFNNTIVSAPTELVSISDIGENIDNASNDAAQETTIELGMEEVIGYELYLYVKNFNNYQEIQNIIKEISLKEKFTSENTKNIYQLIIGPIDNQKANKLVSTFISKGYKETELILK
jgi:rare lipoprotein A